MAPDLSDMKALAVALKMVSKFVVVDRLAVQWIEKGMSEKKAEDFEGAVERHEWYELQTRWEKSTVDLKRSVDNFMQETGCSPILGYVQEADKYGTSIKVFLGYDSSRSISHSRQARGYRIYALSSPKWFLDFNLPTEGLSEEDVYKLVEVERLSDEQETTLRKSFVEDLREIGVEKYEPYMPRYHALVDRRRTYNEHIFRMETLVEKISRERALVPAKPTAITAAAPVIVKPLAVAPALVPKVEAKREVPSEVRVKVKIEEGMNPGEYFAHLLHDGYEAGFSGLLSTRGLKEYLEEKEDYVDSREALGLQGLAEAQLEEELKKLPWPFSSGEEIKVVWTPQDVEFTPTAKEWLDAYNKVYTRAELEAFDLERLKMIAKLKGVHVGKEKAETVANILGEPYAPAAAAPAPAKPPAPERKGLTKADVDRLQDVYSDVLFRALGRIPPSALSSFRVAVEKLMDKTFSEAKDEVTKIAQDIVDSFMARQVAERGVPGRRVEVYKPPSEEERGAPVGRIPPAQVPSEPLEPEEMKFPRGPSSRERQDLWRTFQYRMQEQGYNAFEYEDEFEDYIMGTQFKDWKELLAKFKEFVDAIIEGKKLPPMWQWRGIPIPVGLEGVLRKTPAERLQDVIVHYSSVVIRNRRAKGIQATLADLQGELSERGLIPPDMIITPLSPLYTEIKNALTGAYKRKDIWLTNITLEELTAFLET